jgi:hypothetical protein
LLPSSQASPESRSPSPHGCRVAASLPAVPAAPPAVPASVPPSPPTAASLPATGVSVPALPPLPPPPVPAARPATDASRSLGVGFFPDDPPPPQALTNNDETTSSDAKTRRDELVTLQFATKWQWFSCHAAVGVSASNYNPLRSGASSLVGACRRQLREHLPDGNSPSRASLPASPITQRVPVCPGMHRLVRTRTSGSFAVWYRFRHAKAGPHPPRVACP